MLRALCICLTTLGFFFFFLSYLLSPEDLWCCVGDVNDKIVSRLQTYNQLIVVIIVYNITLVGNVMKYLLRCVIQTFVVWRDFKWSWVLWLRPAYFFNWEKGLFQPSFLKVLWSGVVCDLIMVLYIDVYFDGSET